MPPTPPAWQRVGTPTMRGAPPPASTPPLGERGLVYGLGFRVLGFRVYLP